MKKKQVTKGHNPNRLDVMKSVRISKQMEDFLKKNNLSLPLIVRKALEELGFRQRRR